ncbi:MAG: BMP family protein [Firmicutes bacterium]|nr:BMP family protein [Bacillota bacterium]
MKKLFLMVMVLFLGLAVVGCGSSTTDTKTDSDLKVALVLTGAINDKGWNQKGYEGLVAIAAEYKAETAYNENTQPGQYNQIIRTYAKDGYDVIIAHGTQFSDAVIAVAAEYPDVKFLVSSSDRSAQIGDGVNIAGVLADGVEQGFLQGVTAAYIAQEQGSTKVGAIAGLQIPAFKTTVDGFALGAKYVNPSMQVLEAYTGSTDDVNKLKEQAITFIQQGATVVMSTANAATKGGFEATLDKGGVSIGANSSSQFATYPTNLSASADNDMSKALLIVAGDIVNDKFEAINYIYGVKEGVVSINFSTTEPLALKVKAKVEAIVADIESGKIDVAALYEAK